MLSRLPMVAPCEPSVGVGGVLVFVVVVMTVVVLAIVIIMETVKEPVVALIDHGSKKNLMSMDFYKKGKWSINNKHEWKIRAVTRTMEELHGACPNIRVKVGDVEIDRHFFVQESSSHPVILAEPYITAARTEMKVLHNGSTYARVKS